MTTLPLLRAWANHIHSLREPLTDEHSIILTAAGFVAGFDAAAKLSSKDRIAYCCAANEDSILKLIAYAQQNNHTS